MNSEKAIVWWKSQECHNPIQDIFTWKCKVLLRRFALGFGAYPRVGCWCTAGSKLN